MGNSKIVKISGLIFVILLTSSLGFAAKATYKKSKVCNTCNKNMIWKAAMEVMKDYDLDKIDKVEGYISTYPVSKMFVGKYIIFIKVYNNHFEIKCKFISNFSFGKSYDKAEQQLISEIQNKLGI